MLFASCSVESSGNDSDARSIIGTWTWQKSCGGFAGTQTPEGTGVQVKLVFTKEGRVISYRNNVETGNYPYEIRVGKSIYDVKEQSLLTFNGMTYVILFIDGHNLTIANNFTDGYSSEYKK